jgi:putative transposase
MVYVLVMVTSGFDPFLDLYGRCVVSSGLLQEIEARHGVLRRLGIYTGAVVLWLMIWQRLQLRATLSRAVRELVQGPGRQLLSPCKRVREGRISAAAGGYCQAVKKMPKLVSEQVTRELVERLSREISEPWPGLAGPVFLFDGSSLQLPHTRKLVRAYPPASNQHGQSHAPIVRILVMHEVNSGMALYPQWGPMYGDHAVSEQSLASAAMEQLPEGAVLLADRNFGVFSIAWEATAKKYPVVVRLTKIRAEKLFGAPLAREGDYAVIWQASRWDKPQVAPWPQGAQLRGRLLAFRVGRGKSKQWLYLFTTLDLPGQSVVALYGQRWNIETDLRSLKHTVHLRQLSARSSDGMDKELLAALCAYNLVRAVMALAARRSGLAPRRLSFTQVLDVVNCAWARLIAAPSPAEHDAEFERVLDWAAACKLPHRSKRRSYPRAVWGHRLAFPRRKN